MTGIARGDKYVGAIKGIASDVGQPVQSFQNLARPSETRGSSHRESLKRPGLQPRIAFLRVVRLTGFVIFPTNDE